jgi:hypothetical protein
MTNPAHTNARVKQIDGLSRIRPSLPAGSRQAVTPATQTLCQPRGTYHSPADAANRGGCCAIGGRQLFKAQATCAESRLVAISRADAE